MLVDNIEVTCNHKSDIKDAKRTSLFDYISTTVHSMKYHRYTKPINNYIHFMVMLSFTDMFSTLQIFFLVKINCQTLFCC